MSINTIADKPQTQPAGYSFGTFKGVFTPSVLTILGVIMYLRFGWVLGNVGLFSTLIIVTISTAITFLTGLSISALATNMRVGGGGAYYIISRSLGLETGAAIGLPLFLAQALGISFYIAGFAESLNAVFPILPMKVVGIFSLLLLTLVTFKSADLALKTQYLVLGTIALSLVALFLGSGKNVPPVASDAAVPEQLGFWVVFAVFFPAVTGIEAGLSMSGDLKQPDKSLPLGTLLAISCSYIVYMAIPIFLSRIIQDHRALIMNTMIMEKVAKWGPLIIAGIWGATLSSAMGALLGAPRTLQAIAKDRVIPGIVGKGFGKNSDPRIAMGIAFGIGLAGVIAGDLNMIAPILSMFFLTSYGLLNLSAGFEELIGSPSWRPKFKVPWFLSFLGAFGCFGAMFMINPGATFMAIFVSMAVYYFMRRRTMNARWGDMRHGILMLLVQYGLYKLAEQKAHEKTWRPNILVLSGSPSARWHLVEMASAITHNRGLLTIAAVLLKQSVTPERIENVENTIKEYLHERKVVAMTKTLAANTIWEGVETLVTAYGYGAIVPNTVLMGDSDKTEHGNAYANIIRLTYEYERNLVIVREGVSRGEYDRIDVWWDSKSRNAGLLLALSYLLKTSPGWNKSRLMIRAMADSAEDQSAKNESLKAYTGQIRLEADIDVMIRGDSGVFPAICERSGDASFVFLGLRAPAGDEGPEAYATYYRELMDKTRRIEAPTGFVLAAEPVDFDRIFI